MISIVGVFGYRAFWLFVSGDVIDETVTSIYVYSLEVRGFIVLPTLLELAWITPRTPPWVLQDPLPNSVFIATPSHCFHSVVASQFLICNRSVYPIVYCVKSLHMLLNNHPNWECCSITYEFLNTFHWVERTPLSRYTTHLCSDPVSIFASNFILALKTWTSALAKWICSILVTVGDAQFWCQPCMCNPIKCNWHVSTIAHFL